jgi:hypothetical protein
MKEPEGAWHLKYPDGGISLGGYPTWRQADRKASEYRAEDMPAPVWISDEERQKRCLGPYWRNRP